MDGTLTHNIYIKIQTSKLESVFSVVVSLSVSYGLKVVGSGPIHSILQPHWIEVCLRVTADKD